MKAAYLDKKGNYEDLLFGDVPAPLPGPEEVLVRVHATSVMPSEFAWVPTFSTAQGKPRPFPIVLSPEMSGVIVELGKSVSGLKVGDAIYGTNNWFANGALAEYCVAPADAIAPKPQTLDHTEAAVVPIAALTAWQGLFTKGRLAAGQSVLIHGGAGAVGMFAVQLARLRGANVIATASAHNLDFVRSLGAANVIDYQATRFEDAAKDVDVVFDAVGGETLMRSWAVLRPGGRVVTIASQSQASLDDRSRKAFFIVESSPAQLSEIAQLLDARKLRAVVEAVFPLSQTREAFARAARGGMRGKVAVQVIKN